jgi:hypothetical protein
MTTPANNNIVWILLFPSCACSAATWAGMWVIWRKTRWSDNKILGQATTMPPEHCPSEPRAARDLAVGEEGYVDASQVVISKKNHRTYVAWEARLCSAPRHAGSFSTVAIRRLERGFSLTVRPGDEFRTSPVPPGMYAPVIEIVQAAPAVMSENASRAGSMNE